jgi:hypothetical protein
METECGYSCAYIPPAPSPSSAYAVVWRSCLRLRSCSPRPRLAPSPPLCSTEHAGFKLRRSAHVPTHSQRWRSAGGCAGTSTPHCPPRIALLMRSCLPRMRTDTHGSSSWGGVRAGACMYVRMGLAPMPSYSRGSSGVRGEVFLRILPQASLCSYPTWIRTARALRIWIYFFFLGLNARSHESVEVGWRTRAGALWVRVHSARSLPCSLSVSLAIFPFKLGRIPMFCTI